MANKNTIQGLNIAFGADTTEFDKGQKEVNKQLQASIKYGKELDKALKIDPTSIEKLEKSLIQNEKSLELAQKSADGYNKKLKELSKIDIDDLTKELEDTSNALEKSQKETEALTKSFKELSKTDISSAELEELGQELENSRNNSEKLKESLKEQNKVLKQLDPSNMDKLATQAQKAENQVSALEKEQERLNKDIKSLETKNYEELSTSTKRAAVSTGQLTKEQVGFSQAVKETDMSEYNKETELASAFTDEFGGAVSLATKFLNPYTAALGLAAIGLKKYYDELENNRTASREFATNTQIASSEVDNLGNIASNTSKLLDIDYNESLEYTNQATKLLGDRTKTATNYLEAYSEAFAIANTEAIDFDSELSALNKAQQSFNTSAEDNLDIIFGQISLYDEFGKAADDTADSIIEFGDTMSALGLSLEKTGQTFGIWLEAGARSTDEIVNSYNEFALAVINQDEDIQADLEKLGLSFDTLYDTINQKGINAGILLVVQALADFNDKVADTQGEFIALNDTLTIAGDLFGNYGEEFIGTFAAQGEQVDNLTEALKLYQNQTEFTVQAQDTLIQILANSGIDTTTEQYANLVEQIKNTGAYTLVYALIQQNKLVPALNEASKQGLISKETYKELSRELNAVARQGIFSTAGQTLLGQALQFASDKGIVAESTASDLQERYTQLSTASSILTQLTNEDSKATTELKKRMADLAVEAGNTGNGLFQYSEGALIGKITSESLSDAVYDLSLQYNSDVIAAANAQKSMEKFTDASLTLRERLGGLNDTFQILIDSGVPVDDMYQKLKDSVGELTDSVGDDSAGSVLAFRRQLKITQKSSKAQEEYEEKLEASVGQLDKMKTKTDNMINPMEDFKKSIKDTTNNLDDLVSAMNTYNNTGLNSKSTTITQNTVTTTTPSTQSLANNQSIRELSAPKFSPTGINYKTLNSPIQLTFNVNNVGSTIDSFKKEVVPLTIKTIRTELGRMINDD